MAVAVAGSAAAQPTARMPVSELKPLLKLALERGQAHGVLTGDAAAYLQRRFGTTAPVEIDVRTLHPLPRPGCSRLEVTTRQNGVMEKGEREDKTFRYQLNYCRDGDLPNRK